MINIYPLLAQMTKEDISNFYFMLQDMVVSDRRVKELLDKVLEQINEEFPD